MNRVSPVVCAAALWLAVPIAMPAQEKTMTTSTGMELVWIPAGEFMIGSTPEEKTWAKANGCSQEYVDREGQSRVMFKKSFWLGRTEVTVGQWKSFVLETGYVTDAEKKGWSIAPKERVSGASWRDPKFGFEPTDKHPVCCVSWNDAKAFCEWLTESAKKSGKLPADMVYRLPTEAEWEYACRAGTQTKFWWGDQVSDGLKRVKWMMPGESLLCPETVDTYGVAGRNAFGLADMLGNVREWCLDGFDPAGAHGGLYLENPGRRILRGGSFNHPPGVTRCAVREQIGTDFSYSSLGFRVCCGVPGGSGEPAGYATAPVAATAPVTSPVAAPAPSAAPPPAAGSTMTTSTGMELVWIPAGEFMMGSTPEERTWALGNGASDGVLKREGDQPRRTTIRQGFWLGRTELTVGQWKKFVEEKGYVTDSEKAGEATAPEAPGKKWAGAVKGVNWKNTNFGFIPKDNHPVCCISWNDAVAFCEWLNEREQKGGRLPAGCKFRLPTEAEWEYACRAGTQTRFWWGDSKEDGERRLNWAGAQDGFEYVSPVGHFGARGRNRFGLDDMLGNVAEWCLDDFDPNGSHGECYKGDLGSHVVRGGNVRDLPGVVRCAHRGAGWPSRASANYGFRVCCGMPDGSGQPSQNTAPLVAVVPPSPPASVAPPSAPPPAAPAKPMVAPAPAGPPAVTLRAGSEAALPRTLDKNYEFMDTSKPYVLNGRYEVAKDAEHVTLTVGPGVEIQGGHLFLANKGEVIINGTPEKPAVLRGVTLSQELTAYPMTAKWTLFDKCQLEKKIGWYAYYSSKWACDSCLLYKCTFPNLKGVDYGIKMTHCAFVKMNIPEIVHRQPREGAFDHMKRLRQDWNTITGCQFVDCDVPPTIGWCAEESNFMGCSFKRGVAYESESRTTVENYVADTVGDLPHLLWKGCAAPKGILQVTYAARPYSTFTIFPSLLRPLSSPLPKVTEDTKIMSWLASKPVPFCSGVAKQSFTVAQTETPQKFEEMPSRRRDADKDKANDDKDKAKEEAAKPRVAEKADESVQKDARKFARNQSSIKGLYVVHANSGMRLGGAQDIIATIERAGSDRETICDFTGEVAKDTQISMEEAERLLKVRYPVWVAGHKIRFSYGDKYTKQSGGSAGGAFSVLLLSLLDGMQIDPTYAMTGDVTVDGKIREIGAAAEKIRGAYLEKCAIVAIPVANKENLNDLAVLYSPAMLWNIQIFSVATLDDAASVARVDRAPNLAKAMEMFVRVQRSLGANATAAALRNPGLYRMIWEVQRLAPNHLSAEFMLRAANNQLPATLSLGGSMEEIWAAAGPLLGFLFADYKEPEKSKRYYMERVPSEAFKTAMERLNWLQMRLHPKTRDLRAAMADYMVSLDQLHRASAFSAGTLRLHLDKRDRVLGEALKMGVDRKVLEEMMH